MKNYIVTVPYLVEVEVKVKANDEDEALDLAVDQSHLSSKTEGHHEIIGVDYKNVTILDVVEPFTCDAAGVDFTIIEVK